MISRRIGFRLQLMLVGLVAVVVPLLALWWFVFRDQWLPLVAAILVIWVGLVFSWLGHVLAKQLVALESSSHRLRREEANANMPLLHANQEFFSLSLGLKNMVRAFSQRQRALEEDNAVLQERILERTQELDTMSNISRSMTGSSEEAGLLFEMLGQLEQALDYTVASVWARGNRGVELVHYRRAGENEINPKWLGMNLSNAQVRSFEQIERERLPAVVNATTQNVFSWFFTQVFGDGRQERLYPATRSWMAVPLMMKDEMLGVLRLDHRQAHFFNAERQRLLVAIGYQTALALQHARLSAQSQQLAVYHERNRIARDLHDAVSQSLFASNMTAETLLKNCEQDNLFQTQKQLEELQRLNRGALAEMRLLLYELRPDALEHAALGELLRHVANAAASRNNLDVVFEIHESKVLPKNVKLELYRIAQEAIGNVVKHSHAKQLRLELENPNAQNCMLRILDDGLGFNTNEGQPGHFGLRNMQDRADVVGAKLELLSKPGQGTQVTVIWQERSVA